MDCEGCEYISILESSAETLLAFRRIGIEVHRELEPLSSHLKSCGFEVKAILDEKERYLLAERKS